MGACKQIHEVLWTHSILHYEINMHLEVNIPFYHSVSICANIFNYWLSLVKANAWNTYLKGLPDFSSFLIKVG